MYVKITNGSVDTYPYSVGQLRRDNPNTSFPKQVPASILEGYGVHSVSFSDEPSFNSRTQKISQETSPSLVNGSWTIGWVVSDKTSEEIQQYDDSIAASNRLLRDEKLAETDWVVILNTEKGTSIPADMVTYRQALRDITSNANWPNLSDSDWPTKP